MMLLNPEDPDYFKHVPVLETNSEFKAYVINPKTKDMGKRLLKFDDFKIT